MNGFLSFDRPGLFTTVQDLGRIGYADVGLTPSGVLDRIALRLANALVGNEPGQAALEILHAGPRFVVEADAIRIALVGATPRGTVSLSDGSQHSLPANRTVTLSRGDRVAIDQIDGSSTCIVAVGGGLDLPSVLGSNATYTKASIGGLDGRAIMAGDKLALCSPEPTGPDRSLQHDPQELYGSGPIRAVLGPQDDAFADATLKTFLSATYTVGRDSDRMGLRLDGPELPHVGAYEIPSDGIAPGSIQVPGTRRPIVLLAERGTVGGYTKIATVASADLPRLGRLKPGETLQFAAVTQSQAEQLRREQETQISSLVASIQEAPPFGVPDYSLLSGINLISGIWGSDRGD